MPGGEDEGLNAPSPDPESAEFDSDADFDAVMADLPDPEPQAPAPLNPFSRDPAERQRGSDLAALVDQLTRNGPPADAGAPRVDPNAGIAPGTPDAVRERFPIGLPVTASEAITSSTDREMRPGKVERIERTIDPRTDRVRNTVHVRMDESGRVERFQVSDKGYIGREYLRPVRAEDAPPEFEGYVDPMARERGRRGGNRAALIRRVERGEQRSAAEGDEYEEYMAAAGQARRDQRERMAERGWVSDAGYRTLRQAADDDGTLRPGRSSGRNRATLDALVDSGHMESIGDGGYRLTDAGRAKVGAPESSAAPAGEVPTPNQHASLAKLAHSRDEAEAAGSADVSRSMTGLDAKPLIERGWALDDGPGYRRGMRDVIITTRGREALARAREARPGDDPLPARRRGGQGRRSVTGETTREALNRDRAPEPEPEPPAPARPLDRIHAASGRERGAALRELSDGDLSDIMRDVASDRDAPDRANLINAISRENTRRMNEREAASAAERERQRAADAAKLRQGADAIRAERRAADAELAQRVATLDPIEPGANNLGAHMASVLQRAARSGGSAYLFNDRRNGKRLRVADEPPNPARLMDGTLFEVRADGSAIKHTFTKEALGPGYIHADEKAVNAGWMAQNAGAYIERHAGRAERNAAEPEPYRPLTRDGGPSPADHVDTSGLSEGNRARAHAALQAIARVHRVENMERIHTRNEVGTDNGGGYSAGGGPDGDDMIELNPDSMAGALDFTHEYGHAVDRRGLVMPSLPMYGSQVVETSVPGAPVLSSAEGRAMVDALAAIRASATYKRGRARHREMRTYVDYWSRDVELWARAYAQFIATRSGDETLMRDLRHYQGLAQRNEKDVPMAWTDDEFGPIGDAVEAVLRARGWMD